MARGKQIYNRIARPMGYVDLENNEFNNFLKLKRKGGIFNRLSDCRKKMATMRFSSAKAKADFLKDCMKKSGKKDKRFLTSEAIKRNPYNISQAKENPYNISQALERPIPRYGRPIPRVADPSLGLGKTPSDVGVPKPIGMTKDMYDEGQDYIKSPANPSGNTNGINPVDEGGATMPDTPTTDTPTTDTPKTETKIEANPNKKIFLYGAIGIIVLVFGLKLIK